MAEYDIDEKGFIEWAKKQGMPLDLSPEEGPEFKQTKGGIHLATYYHDITEGAWRAWAHKSIKPRYFPILGEPGFKLPWELIAPHQGQASRNHGQTLERLAERGGLGFSEAAAVMEDRPWKSIKWPEGSTRKENAARVYLEDLIKGRTK